MRVYIRASIYWIFTSCNYNSLLLSRLQYLWHTIITHSRLTHYCWTTLNIVFLMNPRNGNYSASIAHWLTFHRWTLNWLLYHHLSARYLLGTDPTEKPVSLVLLRNSCHMFTHPSPSNGCPFIVGCGLIGKRLYKRLQRDTMNKSMWVIS
jgi:hypothetical protein